MLNMPLNQLIAKGVRRAFVEKCTVTDECVYFRTKAADDFAADVVIVPLGAIEEKLEIEVDFWLCYRDYERMNFAHIDVTKMMYIRETLSQFAAWSQIRAYPFQSDEVNVALVRHIMTDVSDLELMADKDEHSAFFAEIANVANETAVLYNALFAVADNQVTDPAMLPHFISEGDDTEN